jgi:hypothetical protein
LRHFLEPVCLFCLFFFYSRLLFCGSFHLVEYFIPEVRSCRCKSFISFYCGVLFKPKSSWKRQQLVFFYSNSRLDLSFSCLISWSFWVSICDPVSTEVDSLARHFVLIILVFFLCVSSSRHGYYMSLQHD